MMPTPPTATEPTTPPDWPTITFNVICPLCEYNLRGLIEPRCPECGYRFEWPEVLDPARCLHPYLFEHHPEHNVRSFLATILNAQRPRRFWASLHPVQPSRPRRLRLYAWIVLGIYLFGLACIPLLEASRAMAQVNPQRNAQIAAINTALADLRLTANQRIALQQWAQPVLASLRPLRLHTAFFRALRQISAIGVAFLILPALWGWMTYWTLLIFRWSMRRARIKSIHVKRCCVYCFDSGFWLGALTASLNLLILLLDWKWSDEAMVLIPLGWLIGLSLGVRRLAIAYEHYLQFDRPYATIMASQIMVLLLALNIMYLIDPWRVAELWHMLGI